MRLGEITIDGRGPWEGLLAIYRAHDGLTHWDVTVDAPETALWHLLGRTVAVEVQLSDEVRTGLVYVGELGSRSGWHGITHPVLMGEGPLQRGRIW
jgi:hypothetical protein